MKLLPPFVALLMCSSAFGQNQRAEHASPYSATPRAANSYVTSRGGGSPANDDCANATMITLTSNCFNAVEGDNTNATSAGPDVSCDDPGASTLDVWYTFTTGSTGITAINLVPSGTMTDWDYAVYDACGGNEVVCRILPNQGQQEALAPLMPYWLRVYTNPNYGSPGPFTLCIQDLNTVTAPANDDCANVVPGPLAVGNSLSFTGDAAYALNSEGLPYNSLWNAFTTTEAADVRIDLCGTTSVLSIYWSGLYTTCPVDAENRVYPGSANFTDCTDGAATLCFGNLPAGTYYYAVNNSSTPGIYALHFTADPVGNSSPVNDDCAGAVPLSVGASCAPVTFSPSCGSASPPSGGCLDGQAFAEDDVWYSFTATASEMTVGMFPHSLQFGPILEAYSGTCGALSSIGCLNGFSGDTLELALQSLVPGTVYYLKAYNGYFNTPTDDANYDLCLVEGTSIGIGVPETDAPSTTTLYPNPGSGDFFVRTGAGSAFTAVTVFDATGRVVLSERKATNDVFTVHGKGRLGPGAYVVRIDDGRSTEQHRLIVQ